MSLLNKKQKELLRLIRQDLNEATSSSSGSGRFTIPLSPGIRLFNKKQMQPFIIPTSHYDDAELAYDSHDGSLDVSKSKAKKMEDKARKVSKYIKNHPSDNDDDGDILNQSAGKINESEQKTVGELIKSIYPIIMKTATYEHSNHRYPSLDYARKDIIKRIKDGDDEIFDLLRKKCAGMYKEKFIEEVDLLRKMVKHNINEDLAVWFGTKKKPKGSKQPKGPWVNICRKVDGKHPPCGRPEAKDKGYPKCRAAGVASKMSDSQKKSACAQKRRVEKTHSKTGTGNKPKMASYKPKNESNFTNVVKNIIKESTK